MTTSINAETNSRPDSLTVLHCLKEAMFERFVKAGDEYEDNELQYDFALTLLANHSYNSRPSRLTTPDAEAVKIFTLNLEEKSQAEIVSQLNNEGLDAAEAKATFAMLKLEGLVEEADTGLMYPTKEGLMLLRATFRS